MKRSVRLVIFITLLLLLAFSSQSFAQRRPRMGLAFGLGFGAFMPHETMYYAEKAALLHPELNLAFDFSGIRIGASVGYSLLTIEYYDGWWTDSETIIYMPVLFQVAVMPFRFFMPNLAFQLFLGGAVGRFYATSDYEGADVESYAAFGPTAGFQTYIGEWFIIGLEYRYLSVPDPDHSDHNYGFNQALLFIQFRIPFLKREF